MKCFIKRGMVVILIAGMSGAAGCTRVRTYVVQKDRVDQDLSSGNAGFLSGQADPALLNAPRRMTRSTYVAEVEVGRAPRRSTRPPASLKAEAFEEPAGEPVIEEPSAQPPLPKVTSYVVTNNDTLEKISQKVYGTPLKWKKIFEANNTSLKDPNRIYAGQVLVIPEA
jgi:nucleoid-associated protein YgaU